MIRSASIHLSAALALLGSAPAQAADAGACAMKPVLMEEFDTDSIAASRIGPARWTAHTPWNGDFGDARFLNPGPTGPFVVRDGMLSITASKGPDGKWTSGLIAAADPAGAGEGTLYGYFEARMKLPPGPGTWPAFWLGPLHPVNDGVDPTIEVDVIEYYGHAPQEYRTAIHVWHKADPTKNEGDGKVVPVPPQSLVDAFHTYGVDISPKIITYLFDGKPVWQTPTPSAHHLPLFPLVNLALGSGWPIDKTPNPSVMLVDYVHVYSRGPATDCLVGPPAR